MKKHLFFFFFSIYLLTASGHLYVRDETCMGLLTKRILEDKSLSLLNTFPDSNPPPVIGRNGKLYSPCGIGQSIFVIPFCLFGNLLDRAFGLDKIDPDYSYILSCSLFNSFVTALSTLILFIFSLKIYSPKTSFLLALFYGTGSMAWPYSKYFFNQPVSCLFLLLAFYNLYLYTEKTSLKYSLLSGGFIGLSILTRTDNLITVPCFFLYLLLYLKTKTKAPLIKTIICFFLPIILSLMMVALYNFIRFESLFRTGYENMSNDRFCSPIEGLYGMLFASGGSIFLYNPILLLLPFCYKEFYRRRKNEAIFFGIFFFIFLLTYSQWESWAGGGTWGPRFLLPTIPFLILPLGVFIEEKMRFKKVILSCLFLFAIWVQIVGISVDFNKYVQIMRKLCKTDIYTIFYPQASPIAGHTRILMNKLFKVAPNDPVVKEYKEPLDFWFILLADYIPFPIIYTALFLLILSATVNLYLILRRIQC